MYDKIKDLILGPRKYVSVIYDSVTQFKLREYCMYNRFDLTKDYNGNSIQPTDFQFHTTIFFTVTRHKQINNNIISTGPQYVYPYGFEILGQQNNIPTVRVHSEYLDMIRKDFANVGMKDSWDGFKPHITLSYNYDNNTIRSDLKLPEFPLIFDRIVIKDASV